MNKYTGRKNESTKINNARLSKTEKILDTLKVKYGFVNEEMEAAVIASFNNNADKRINGCQGLEETKCPVRAIYVVGKKGDKLNIIAVDQNGEQRRGCVDQAKLYDIMGIVENKNEKIEEEVEDR